MKVGDLVRYHDRFGLPENDARELGVVTGVEKWVDKGAPDRNFGVHVFVLWSSGIHATHEEIELEVISEGR